MSQASDGRAWLRGRAGLPMVADPGSAGDAGGRSQGSVSVLLDYSAGSWRALAAACDRADREQRQLLPILAHRRTWLDGLGEGSVPAAAAAAATAAAVSPAVRLDYDLALIARGYERSIVALNVSVALNMLIKRDTSIVITTARIARSIGRRAAKRGITVVAVP